MFNEYHCDTEQQDQPTVAEKEMPIKKLAIIVV